MAQSIKNQTRLPEKHTILFNNIKWWAPPLEELPAWLDTEVIFTNSWGQVLQTGILKGVSINHAKIFTGLCVIEGPFLDNNTYRKESWSITSSGREDGTWTIYVNNEERENSLRNLAFKLLIIKREKG